MIHLTCISEEEAWRHSPTRWLTFFFLFLCSAYTVPVEAAAVEIVILKSSDLKAYNEAIEGFKRAAPGAAVYTEYDLRGDLERGKLLARKIRTSDSSLVVAVGLKAALAAKLEIVDIPILYMMILDPLKHHLTAANMTGVLLGDSNGSPVQGHARLLPSLRRIATLYDPNKTAAKLKEAEPRAAVHEFQLRGFAVGNERRFRNNCGRSCPNRKPYGSFRTPRC